VTETLTLKQFALECAEGEGPVETFVAYVTGLLAERYGGETDGEAQRDAWNLLVAVIDRWRTVTCGAALRRRACTPPTTGSWRRWASRSPCASVSGPRMRMWPEWCGRTATSRRACRSGRMTRHSRWRWARTSKGGLA